MFVGDAGVGNPNKLFVVCPQTILELPNDVWMMSRSLCPSRTKIATAP